MTMVDRKRYRKLWLALLIPVAVTVAGVTGGIEWAFASLGVMVLISMAGIIIYVPAKVLRHSYTSNRSAKARPITERDKKLIMRHIDELLVKSEEPAEVRQISKGDKRLIIEHIDELFVKSQEQNLEKPAQVRRISKEDKKLIMRRIDELFAEGREQGQEQPS